MIGAIDTKRLILRELSPADAGGVFQLVNSPGWLKNIGNRNVQSSTDAENYIQTWALNSYTTHGYGPYAVLTKSNEFIGICGLFQRDYLDIPDVGFAFLPDYIGMGYGFESSEAVMQHACSLGLKKLAGITSNDNVPSQNLLMKLGFKEKPHAKVKDGVYFEIGLS